MVELTEKANCIEIMNNLQTLYENPICNLASTKYNLEFITTEVHASWNNLQLSNYIINTAQGTMIHCLFFELFVTSFIDMSL